MSALTRVAVVSLVISLVLIGHILEDHTQQVMGAVTRGKPYRRRINCPKECKRRCSSAFMSDKCYAGCMACCHKCSCVPPGTYGNSQDCSCYANLKNSKNGKPKCP